MARYVINPDSATCEFALVVADNMHGKGPLMEAARAKGLSVVEGEELSNNHNMLKLMTRIGFSIKTSEDDPGIMKVSKTL